MSDIVFNGRFIPQSSVQFATDEFDVDADFFDGLGLFSALDIMVNDIVFLDCFASFTAPGTVNRYKVIQINSASGMQVNCRIKWEDRGTIIDPGEVTGSAGFICRPSDNQRLPNHSAPTVHTIPDYVIQYSRNNDLQNIIDPFQKKYVKNETGFAFNQYKMVAWEDDGSVALADASVHELSDIAGITLKIIPDDSWGWVNKNGYIADALTGLNAKPGDTVYLSADNPGDLTLIAPTGYTDTIIKVGRAEPPSGVKSSIANDLHMEMEVIAEP